MYIPLRQSASRGLETLLRWLTRSALRTTAIFVILTFVPILLLTYYIVASSIRGTKADALSNDRQVRDFAADVLRADFSSASEALMASADDQTVQRAAGHAGARTAGHAGAADANLRRLLRRHAEFAFVALYAPDGTEVAAEPATAEAPVPASPPPGWFEAAARGQSALSPVLAGGGAGPLLVEAVPVPETGAANGVLAAGLPVRVVNGWMSHLSPGPNRAIYLLDSARHVIAATGTGTLPAAQAASLPGVREALAGRSGNGETRIEFGTDAIAWAPLEGENLVLLVVRPVQFRFYLYRVLYDKLALIAVIVFLLAVASGLLLRSAFRYYQRYNREVEHGRSKTEALLGSIGDGVFAVDSAGRVIEFNRAAAALTQRTAVATLGRPYSEAIALVDERGEAAGGMADPVVEAMRQNRALRFGRDRVLLRPDGSRVPVTVTAAPVRDEEGAAQGCVVVLSDASQEREVDRMKNEFISIASHQLRTPMSGVKGALALLLEDVLGPLNREQHDYIRRAYESNERLIALVNDLLNVSRLEQGQMQLRQDPVNLAALLPALLTEYQGRAARYQQQLRYEADPVAEATVLGDAVRLREVFANLLDNAVKYTPEGGTVVLSLRLEGDRVMVSVRDSGVGIPPEKLGSLFQKFNRIQNPLSGRESGTGLGLYFVRSVVELHLGKIEVESQPERGTTFRVLLPRAAPPTASSPASGVLATTAPANAA